MADAGALDALLSSEDRLVLTELLQVLDETERSLVLLHAVSGYTHAELAERLGMPLGTVLTKYHRGLKKLRKAMGDGHEER